MRSLIFGFLLCAASFSQTLTFSLQVGSAAVQAYQPVTVQVSSTPGANYSIIPANTTVAIYGYAQKDGNPNDVIPVATYGSGVCKYDTVPTQGNIATIVLLNGVPFCHDSGLTGSGQVPENQAQPGRILRLRTDLCATCAETNIKHPAAQGSQPLASLLVGAPVAGATANNDGTMTLTFPDGTQLRTAGDVRGPAGDCISVAASYTFGATDYAVVETSAGATVTLFPAPKPSQIAVVKDLSTGDISVVNSAGKIDTGNQVTLHSGESMTFQNIKNTADWIIE